MYFSNRRDIDEVLDTLDQTSCSKMEFQKDGFETKVSFDIYREVDEYRYVTVDDRLYFITDYKVSNGTTSITAIDFISKWADTISLDKGTWTIDKVLNKINGYSQVKYINAQSASVDTTETTKASDIITQIENNINGVILYETVLDTANVTSNSAYYPVAKVVNFDDNTLEEADIIIASDEFDVETDYNPQLDLAYNLTLSIKNVDNIAMLNSYKSVMSTSDFNAVSDYISGKTGGLDADGASKTIIKYLSFNKKNFKKVVGNNFINNTLCIDDEFSYSIGEFDFETKSILEMYIVRYLLGAYQAKNVPSKSSVDIMHHHNIVAVNGDDYYLAKSYTYDYLHHVISDIKIERQ